MQASKHPWFYLSASNAHTPSQSSSQIGGKDQEYVMSLDTVLATCSPLALPISNSGCAKDGLNPKHANDTMFQCLLPPPQRVQTVGVDIACSTLADQDIVSAAVALELEPLDIVSSSAEQEPADLVVAQDQTIDSFNAGSRSSNEACMSSNVEDLPVSSSATLQKNRVKKAKVVRTVRLSKPAKKSGVSTRSSRGTV